MNKRRIELYLIDTAVFLAVYWLMSCLAEYDFSSLHVNSSFTIAKLTVIYLCIMGCRGVGKIYKNIWRYADVAVYLKLIAADLCGGILFIALGRIFPSLSLGAACAFLTVMAIMTATLFSRFAYQFLYIHMSQSSDVKAVERTRQLHKINIAIVGAGNIGATLAQELMRNPKSRYQPCCFIDKDVNKIGSCINGLPIYPEDENIIKLLNGLPVQEIVVALPDASSEDRTRLYHLYQQTGCEVKLYDYPFNDRGQPEGERTLREFRIEDLLFRDSLSINSAFSAQYYRGKTILVTGGGGSIGSELCRQLAELNPKKLVILDIYENNAYDIQQELIRKHGKRLRLETLIASVRDEKRLEEIFDKIRPDIVFHAAAHKHVPLMEESGCEAIKNNVMGTYYTANMAEKYGVQKFLLVSTDKAVNPTNVMGASKRLCEMVIQCRTDSATEFTAVRFGNVLGSNGSVIPLFKRQIEAGGPITLTDKRIIRYFMTIPEAVGLVMETGAMAHNGELFVLDMGKPVKILDLAENMIRLCGLKPYEDIDIVEIGLRPGEKLYEELLMKTEELDKTSNDMIFIERDKGLSRAEVEEKLTILLNAIDAGGYQNLIKAIRRTVPTYHRPEEINEKAGEAEEMNASFTKTATTVA